MQPNDELYHHGIKGMRWGVRRNRAQLAADPVSRKIAKLNAKADSDVAKIKATGEAAARLKKAQQKADSRVAKARAKYKVPEQKEPEKKKSLSDYSDAELVQMINRANLEAAYKKAISSPMPAHNSKSVKTGENIVSEILKKSLKKGTEDALSQIVKNTLIGVSNKVAGSLKPDTEDQKKKG